MRYSIGTMFTFIRSVLNLARSFALTQRLPCRSIEITGNTVRNCGYFGVEAGIAVYIGGPFSDRPGLEPFAQLHDGVQIAHNAVYSSAGPGISVIGARKVEIHGNVITDCSSCNRKGGSVYLNAVAEGE